jgi:AcrR family transcriptional regulator
VPAIEAPRNARSRRTREALLAAARSLIEDAGLEALTMAAAADRAGVTRRAVYLHFASRAELLTALFGHINETGDLAASTRPVWSAPDAASALDEWAGHLARYHPRLIRIGRALQRARDTDPDAAAHWAMVTRDWRAHCRRIAGRLDREGRLAPPWTVQTATDMLWALMSFDVIEGLVVERHWSRRRLADHLAKLFRATFVAR